MQPGRACLNELPLTGRADFEKHYYQQARDQPERHHNHHKCKHRDQPGLMLPVNALGAIRLQLTAYLIHLFYLLPSLIKSSSIPGRGNRLVREAR